MKTRRTRKAAPAAAALAVAAGVVLAGCSSGDGSTTQAPSAPSPTASTVKVTDMALGEELDKLVLQGAESSSKDGGACLASSVRKAGMPEEALASIAKADSDDMGAAIDGLNKVSEDDAALLASRSLREDFDACIDKAAPNGSSLKTPSYRQREPRSL
ncbi:hypothetical protein ACWCQQ_38350 [Streptomyces sp. NPDC002143]